MKLRYLETFIAVAEELHFGRAAARLHVAQPAVSQTISALEEELGVELFDRSNRRVRLTPAGRAYFENVADVFRQLEHASTAAHEADAGIRGRLVVGFTAVCTLGPLPGAIAEFMRHHPKVSIEARPMGTTEQVEALRLGTIDVGFSVLPGDLGPIHTQLVAPDELHVFLSTQHPLAEQDRVPMEAILGEPLVLMSRSREPCVHRFFDRAGDEHGLRGNVVMELDHLEAIFAFVAAGLGVSVAPSLAGRLELDGLTSRPLDPRVAAGISAIWIPASLSEPAARFLSRFQGTEAAP